MNYTTSGMTRRNDLDCLRVLAVLMLIPFHTARLFDFWEPNYVKNAELSAGLTYQIAFIGPWHMPLLLLLAGAATWYALGFRSSGEYVWERFKRLLVPLAFGVLVIVPPQAYLARFQVPGYAGTYLQFLTAYFTIRGDLTGYTGLFTPGHLWFILFLFIFSLVALPLFLFLKRDGRFVAWLLRCCEKRGTIFLLAIPLGIAGALPGISGKNPFFYIILFIYGYLLMGNVRYRDVIDRHKGVSLILGVAAMMITITLWALPVQFRDNSPKDILFYSLRTFNTWFWLIAILGYGQRYLNFNNRVLQYANEAAYPFYILHQTVIIVIGYFVVRLDVNLWVKYCVIALVSFAITLLLYDVCVKRTSVTRFLFGMKLQERRRKVQVVF
jgi:glucan biosynthesis protein C